MTDVVQRLNTALDGRYRIEREHGILVLDRWIGERYVVEARLLEVPTPCLGALFNCAAVSQAWGRGDCVGRCPHG